MEEPIKEEETIVEWTTAVEALDISCIQELFDVQPSLLWTPLKTTSHYESDFAHFIQRLKDFKLLGTSINPVYALHYVLFDYGTPGDEWIAERTEIVDFILKNTKGNELNSFLWGAEQNTVMHLALLLNQQELTQQLLNHSASTDIPNKLGHLPLKEPLLKTMPKENASDKFKRLKKLAESPNTNTAQQQNKSNVDTKQDLSQRYFRPGHLEERKRRVLSEEEEEAEKLKSSSRQKDIQLLAQRSAVKNNPLFKKFEEQNQQPASKSPVSIVRDRSRLLNAADQIKRSSRVINSLKENSYVSSSIFRQQSSNNDNTISTVKPIVPQKNAIMLNTETTPKKKETDIKHTLPPTNKEEESILHNESHASSLIEFADQESLVKPTTHAEDEIESLLVAESYQEPVMEEDEILKDEIIPPALPPKNKSRPSSKRITRKPSTLRSMFHLQTIDETNIQPIDDDDTITQQQQQSDVEPETFIEPQPTITTATTDNHTPVSIIEPTTTEFENVDTFDDMIDAVNQTLDEMCISSSSSGQHAEDVEKELVSNTSLRQNEPDEDDKRTTAHPVDVVISRDHRGLDEEHGDSGRLALDNGLENSLEEDDHAEKEDHAQKEDNAEKEHHAEKEDNASLLNETYTDLPDHTTDETHQTSNPMVTLDKQNDFDKNTTASSQSTLQEDVVPSESFIDNPHIYKEDSTSSNYDQLSKNSLDLDIIRNTSDPNQQHNRKSNTQPLTIQADFIEEGSDDDDEEDEATTPTLANPHTLLQGQASSVEEEEEEEDSNRDSFVSVSQSEEWYDPDDWQSNRNSQQRQSDSSGMTLDSSEYSFKRSNSTEITRIGDDESDSDEDKSGQEYHEIEIRIKQEVEPEYEGEIVVYMDSAPTTPDTTTSQQYLDVVQDDDTHSLIRVPSQTNTIYAVGQDHEMDDLLPHDPKNPRLEDISHYIKELPPKETEQQKQQQQQEEEEEEGEDGGKIKRVKSIPHAEEEPASTMAENEMFRGIPNAHELSHAFSTSFDLMYFGGEEEEKRGSVVTGHGKMYVSVSGIHHVLLPVPKEPTYVRCIVSDGEYEYMSRYEPLSHQMRLDYECIIDTKPGMIITVSLHVRQDQHVMPKSGWSKWFTSIRKQKEHLSGYVYPEDGAIGQTRLAVDHMVPGCYKKTYQSYFDCFNSWYARTNQERARREKFGDEEDFLKIAGKLNVSMLYLPVSSPSVQVPKSMRECDLTLKICQWHETCWQSGYLSTRIQGTKVWERHYYRLIGSQLIGYTGNEEECQVYNHYNISDVIRLSAASDKIIITLVEEETNRVFMDSILQESNEKGFFRLSFKDYYVDCVCDTMDESEEWVNTLKSMIGRVQRFHYILDGIKNIF